MNNIFICDSVETLAVSASGMIIASPFYGIGDRRLKLGLSGGSTPGRMYDKLAQDEFAAMVIREKVEFFFSDERSVGPDSDQSNYGLAHRRLFQPLGIDEQYVHRMRGEETDLDAEARRYEELIIEKVDLAPDGVPSFDLIFLGLGPDGHTASLFPDCDFDGLGDKLVAAPYVKSQDTRRITFTPRLINAARRVVFLATGEDKSEVVRNVLSSGIKVGNLPANRIMAADMIWFLDRAAAGTLKGSDVNGIISRC